jgi:hypothetical protein
MTTVTGLTAERMLEIEGASVVDGDIIGGELVLTKHDGSTVNAGSVVGPPGPAGPMGSDLAVLVEHAILDVGMSGQLRAGRQLKVEDFTNLGLSAPLALWNLSDLTDISGNGYTLTKKGTVSQVQGVDGLATSAVQFLGSTSAALFIDDIGTADPFRLKVGSWGIWFRTPKRDVYQTLISKRGAAGTYSYWLRLNTSNVLNFGLSSNGTDNWEINSLTKLCDDRWHFAVGTYDGIVQQLYVDGTLEASILRNFPVFGSAQPLNIGAYGANATIAASEPLFGRTDEAFLTSEILNEERIHSLYCAKIPHTLGVLPSGISLSVHPGSKGGSVTLGDFPVNPLRLHNFSAGSLGNEGSNGVAGLLTPVGTPLSVCGVDGTKNNAINLSGTQRLVSTDTGLPAGLSAAAYGLWFKTATGVSTMYLMTWGTTNGTNDARIYIVNGAITFGSGSNSVTGPFVADGNWHFVVVDYDNSASDGLKRKFYLDGRLIASSTVLNSITLGGANKFVIGSSLSSANNFAGQVDSVFVSDAPLTFEQTIKLFTKSLYGHVPSPKNAGDHIQAMNDQYLLAAFDTLDIADKINLKVMA